ncbi:MAG: exo-alpha-sialidase [Clostridiales bacterium]|nr:exo-alpha-sialidase [Clostridiales bacterium]
MKHSKRRTVLLLPPGGEITRQSEGSFLRLKDGGILFVWSRFLGDWIDDAPSDILGITSYDEGESWSEPRTLITGRQFGVDNVMSCSLLRMANGDLGLYYLVKASPWANQVWLSRSRDEGQSFDPPRQCSFHRGEGLYVINNHRVQRLSSGRIIIPLAFHRVSRLEGDRRYFDGRAVTVFLYSDDDGVSYHESPQTVSMPSTRSNSGLQEPGVIELADNLLWGYARTDMMFQYEFFSLDGGLSWTQAQPSRFTSPNAPMLVVREPGTQTLYAIFNPIPNYLGRQTPPATAGRTPFVYCKSADNGHSWAELVIIEDDPGCGYCYPATLFTKDGCLLLSYCSGASDQPFCLTQTTLSKIDLTQQS